MCVYVTIVLVAVNVVVVLYAALAAGDEEE